MRRQVILSEIHESSRSSAVALLSDCCAHVLRDRFPVASGFKQETQRFFLTADGPVTISWHVSRGAWWGLRLAIKPESESLKTVSIDADRRLPAVDPASRALDRLDRMPGQAVLAHLLLPLLILPAVILIPILLLYRFAVLLSPDVRRTIRALESTWRDQQATFPTPVPMLKAWSPALICFAGLVVGLAAIFGCLWLIGIAQAYAMWLYMAVAFLTLMSLVSLIGMVMSLLGMDIHL